MARGRSTMWALALVGWLGSACVISEGDVLTSVGSDGGADGPTGDADPCAAPGPCPVPAAGDVTICGRVIDVETSQPVTGGEPDVRVFDLDELRLDANPEELALVTPDECGWFTTTIHAVLGNTVIHTGELFGGGDYARATSLIDAPAGQRVQANAYVLRDQTDQTWSEQAGLSSLTVADRGAVLPIYVDLDAAAVGPFQGGPVSGVTATVDGNPSPSDDYYFSDTDPLSRGQVAPALTATGIDGAALLLSPTGTLDVGGQKSGCTFEPVLAASILTMVQVQEVQGHCN